MSKNLLFEIEGFKVFKGTRYVINNKIDYDAPSGFEQAGTTRLPSDGVGESYFCPFDREAMIYDTGFFEDSPCYRHLDSESRKIIVDNLVKNVMEPFSKLVGGENILHHTNLDFWDKRRFFIEAGLSLNTDNIKDVVTLYYALRHRKLCPKGKESDGNYRDAAYVVVDINNDIKRKDEKVNKTFNCITKFSTLLKTDKNRLISILDYMSVKVSDKMEDSTLMSMFDEYIRQNESHIDRFNGLIEETSTDLGREKIEIYLKLKDMRRRGEVEQESNGILYIGDTELGPDLQQAASNIARLKELADIKRKVLIGDD